MLNLKLLAKRFFILISKSLVMTYDLTSNVYGVLNLFKCLFCIKFSKF